MTSPNTFIPWSLVRSLEPAHHRQVLALLDALELQLKREGLDEGLRLDLERGRPALHALRLCGEDLVDYALVRELPLGSREGALGSTAVLSAPVSLDTVSSDTVNLAAVIEKAGGGWDSALCEILRRRFTRVDWWLRELPCTRPGDAAGLALSEVQPSPGAEPAHPQQSGEAQSALPPGATLLRSLDFMALQTDLTGLQPLLESSPRRPVPSDLVLRPFDPERDAAAWLELNALAFAEHPEQGAWTRCDLSDRLQQPWFDPRGFFLLERQGRLLASLWTKPHVRPGFRFGEVYVVAVHPEAQGLGLARHALLHAARWLAQEGFAELALYVESNNQAALALYQGVGFARRRRDVLVRFEGVAEGTSLPGQTNQGDRS